MDVSLDHGVNLIDTSNIYTTGKSEELLGEVLKGRSSQILVGTKVRFSMGKGPNEQGLSRYHIIEQCEASLKRLQRDRIDIYYLHEWDGQTPVEETMEALDTLVKQGKVRYAACSNFSGWHIMKCLMAAERHNYQRFVCQQIHYTVETRDAEYELAAHRHRPGRRRTGVEPDRGRASVRQVPPQCAAAAAVAPPQRMGRAADPRREPALPHHRGAGGGG